MAIHIRRATPGDLRALLDLYVQLSPENTATDAAKAADGLREILRRPDMSLLMAEVDGSAAGSMTLVLVPNLTHNARPWIQLENMVVDERARRAGVGRALLGAAFDLAREHDAYKIQLQSAEQRRDAHAFYESLGFRSSSLGFRLYFD